MSNEIRVESKIRNNPLWKATVGKYGSVAKFCENCWKDEPNPKSKQGTVGRFLNLKETPYKDENELKPIALDIVLFTETPIDELFPVKLYEYNGPTSKVQEVDIERLDEIESPQYSIEDGILDKMESKQVYNLVKQSVYSSTVNSDKDRLFDILVKRFGLDGGHPMRLHEVGELYNLHPDRIRQLESKTLKILRRSDNFYFKSMERINKSRNYR